MAQGDIRYETTLNKLWKDVGTNDWFEIFSEGIYLDGGAFPTADNDDSAGFAVNSLAINVSDGTVYVCTDNTDGAAVWLQIGGGGSGTDEVLFTIDQDNTGTATSVSLVFEGGGTDPDSSIVKNGSGDMVFTTKTGRAFIFQTTS